MNPAHRNIAASACIDPVERAARMIDWPRHPDRPLPRPATTLAATVTGSGLYLVPGDDGLIAVPVLEVDAPAGSLVAFHRDEPVAAASGHRLMFESGDMYGRLMVLLESGAELLFEYVHPDAALPENSQRVTLEHLALSAVAFVVTAGGWPDPFGSGDGPDGSADWLVIPVPLDLGESMIDCDRMLSLLRQRR